MNGTESILIVDNDPDLQDLIEEALEPLNTRIFKAIDASEAKKIIEKNIIRVVITDLEMPIVDGEALIAWCHEYDPTISTVLISGNKHKLYQIKVASVTFLKPLTDESLRGIKYFIHNCFLHSENTGLRNSKSA